MAEEEEQNHWNEVMRTFLFYEEFVATDLARRQEHINRLRPQYADRLPNVSFAKFGAITHAARANQDLFEDMVHFQVDSSSGSSAAHGAQPVKAGAAISMSQQHRNIAVLHSLYREWSLEAVDERKGTFGLLLAELQRRLPVTASNMYQQKVLAPGCGLGRLPLEIAASGYACQGNELSAFMLIAGNFMLNGSEQYGQYTIHPWVSDTCNLVSVQDALQGVTVPDVAPGELLGAFQPPTTEGNMEDPALPVAQTCPPSPFEPGLPAKWRNRQQQKQQGQEQAEGQGRPLPDFPRFSMMAGDFAEVYTNLKDLQFAAQQGSRCVDAETGVVFADSSLAVDAGAAQWDAVVTCFFMDTAPVILEYVEVIERILKPGGVWINLGPLLYHWATPAEAEAEDATDPRYKESVELSYEEVRHVVEGYGLEILHEQWQDCTYSRRPSSMMWTSYRTVLFTARKPVVLCRDCKT